MNFNKCLLFIMLLLLCISVNAQTGLFSHDLSSIAIDKISDNDIKTYYEKALDNGITEEKLYDLLAEKGMSDAERDKLKERISLLSIQKTPESSTAKSKENASATKNTRQVNEDAFKTPMADSKYDSRVFGSELFSKNSMVFEPNLRIPTPSGYIIGPDDELIVNVFGFSEKNYSLLVNSDGSIYIPQVGPLQVSGLSIEQASQRINSKLSSTIYKAMKGGQTNIQVTLGKIRSIRVTVIGEAKKPGTYTISSLTSLFNLLYLCGGPSDMGSYRKIELYRGNELKKKIDLYSFLIRGDQKGNVLLQEGDVIRIPYLKTQIILDGKVKHPGKFEMLENEKFTDALDYCGGFSDDAYKGGVSVYQLSENARKITDLDKSQFSLYQPQPSDSIFIGKLQNRYENRLTIKGAVVRPGEYELTANISLKELIQKAGGLKEDVYINRGCISRLNTDKTPIQLSFNIDSVMNGWQKIDLKRDDSVTIYSIFDLRNNFTVNLDGSVNKPGFYKWIENMTVRDLVLTAGGFTDFADVKKIEVARRIKNAEITVANHKQTEIFNVDLSDSVQSKDFVLQPYDEITVRQKAGYTNQRAILVDGMVMYPGRYNLSMSSERVNDIIKRVGGFKANADSSTVIIKRYSGTRQTAEEREKLFSKLLNIKQDSLKANERIKNEIIKNYDVISINLKKALSNPKGSENMLLDDGDVVIIERNSNLVKVSGDVYFPTLVPLKKGAGLKYYIQKSGSFTRSARRNATLVLYPDGNAKKVRHFLFFRFYPKIRSRAEIFVPQKSNLNRTRISTGEWALMVSALGIIANVIKK